MAQEFAHEPVLAAEVVSLFAPVPDGVLVDATVGGGGHAAALLDAYPRLSLLGLDRDSTALRAAAASLSRFGDRVALRRARFSELERAAGDALEGRPVAGVLFDLGVSSPQLDRPERGFSYRLAGPLDMRMDQLAPGPRAADLVNGSSEGELVALFAASGEARHARRIARALIAARPIETTTELAAVVAGAVPAAGRRRGHPARRVFQALRIAVNDELAELGRALPAAVAALAPGGRCVVIAYHSGEDRLVKQVFAEAARGGCTCPPGLPCVCGARPLHRLVFRGSRKPSAAEVARNHRAESARLRALERLAGPVEEP
ncbi:MAG TPA: 16S rRNA (cytosine(1402)-N(4))-methyltransferase RsmH [Acidimicrobiales bacterium]|nr:16S rRNA (cytosine(1402)-N(4))-methyltransferase RsmH [Acidimicrobiales bacterium]